MKSTEEKAVRVSMVSMHQFFLDRIDLALEEKRYIEASWLIYACIENRFFRTLQKFKKDCKYCTGKCKKKTNELALNTKIDCVRRLCEAGVECIASSFTAVQLDKIKAWVKRLNTLMHKLLSLDTYNQIDANFEELASEGKEILDELYDSCTNFRRLFYEEGYEFVFPEIAMEGCPCKPKKEKEA